MPAIASLSRCQNFMELWEVGQGDIVLSLPGGMDIDRRQHLHKFFFTPCIQMVAKLMKKSRAERSLFCFWSLQSAGYAPKSRHFPKRSGPLTWHRKNPGHQIGPPPCRSGLKVENPHPSTSFSGRRVHQRGPIGIKGMGNFMGNHRPNPAIVG